MTDLSSNPQIRHWADLEPYTPARHTGTVNRHLMPGDATSQNFSVVHGAIEFGGEAEAHHHARSSQFFHVLSGTCRLTLGEHVENMGPGDSVLIPVGVRHRVEVTSQEGITLINVYQPALAPDDILA